MRAVTNFMETLTILMFPIGCIFIAGGVFIIQNLQDPTSAITALFIFAIGCGIIMLAVLGYFGTVIHSRGMNFKKKKNFQKYFLVGSFFALTSASALIKTWMISM